MNGLIGNVDSAKFIFVAIEDESQLPTKSVMKNYFPNHQMNIYKAWGYFSSSFESLESYIKIKHDGIESHSRWSNNKTPCISHAIRMNAECEFNSFFALQYSHLIVANLHLSHTLMDELNALLKVIGETNALIDSIVDCKDKLSKGVEIAKKHQFPDAKMSKPSNAAMADLFNYYGDGARQELSIRLDDWNTRALWT